MLRIPVLRSNSDSAYCRGSGSRWTTWQRWLLAVLLLASLLSGNAQSRQWFEFGATMDMSPIATDAALNPDSIAVWESLTSGFYVDALLARTDLSPPISDPQVSVTLTVASRATSDTTGLTLAMQFTATASFVSDSTSYDPSMLALPSFNDQTAVLNYVVSLRESSQSVFQSLSTLSLKANTSVAIPAPTPAPTVLATTAPSSTATPAPTPVETSVDTTEPTVDTTTLPTNSKPSFSLTAPPVQAATPAPTDFPTDAPSGFDPGPQPGNDPTASPTSSPVASPTTNLQSKFATTELVFHYVPSRMPETVQDDWKRVTVGYLITYIQNLDGSLLRGDNSIQIEKVTQQESRLRLRGRRLQTNANISLSIEFITKLELPPEVDANSLVNGAFTTRSRREDYQATLKDSLEILVASGDASNQSVSFFSSLEQISYISDSDGDGATDDVPSSLVTGDQQGQTVPVGTIVGAAVGGLAVVLIIASLILRSKSNKGVSNKDLTSSDAGINSDNANNTKELSPTGTGNGTSRTAAGLTWEPAEQPSRLNQEILVQDSNYDDVSTIGDPFVYGQPPSIPDDDRTATTSVLQTDTYNSLLCRDRLEHEPSFSRSHADDTDFSAFTGMSKYLNNAAAPPVLNQQQPHSLRTRGLLGELGLDETDETSFEQRLFPMDKDEELEQYTTGEERSLDYSLPTALM